MLTIGLTPVFSLGWSLPPDLSCVLKQAKFQIESCYLPSVPNEPNRCCSWPWLRKLWTTCDEHKHMPLTHESHLLKPFTYDGIWHWASPSSLIGTDGILLVLFFFLILNIFNGIATSFLNQVYAARISL